MIVNDRLEPGQKLGLEWWRVAIWWLVAVETDCYRPLYFPRTVLNPSVKRAAFNNILCTLEK